MWADLTDNMGVCDTMALVGQDVMEFYRAEGVGARNSFLVGSLVLVPMPWQRWPSSSAYEVSHIVLYFGWRRSWRCSSVFPMAALMTGRARFIAVGDTAGVSVGRVMVTVVWAGLAWFHTRSITLVATVGGL